jgi:outer membrane protein TolC
LPGCGGGIHVKQEFKTLQESVAQQTMQKISWRTSSELQKKCLDLENKSLQTLTREQAIAYALEFNPSLQAKFQELGIAKADLIESGLFTNPEVATLFRFPHDQEEKVTNIEAEIDFQVADLWQVPLRKKVSADQLEIITQGIIQEILETIEQASIAYDACLYAQEKLHIIQEIMHIAQERYTLLKERFNYGFNDELAIYRQESIVAQWELEYKQQSSHVKQAFWHLLNLLGLSVNVEFPTLANTFNSHHIELPPADELFSYAQKHHPSLLITELQIQRYKHLLSYERSRVIPSLKVGLAHDREYEAFNALGPAINFEFPVFNQNQAGIARAQFLLDQAHHVRDAELGRVQEEIFMIHEDITRALHEISLFTEKLIPATEHALTFATHYSKTMQITSLEFNDTLQAYYDAQQKKLDSLYQLQTSLAKLEQSVGKKLLLSERKNEHVLQPKH